METPTKKIIKLETFKKKNEQTEELMRNLSLDFDVFRKRQRTSSANERSALSLNSLHSDSGDEEEKKQDRPTTTQNKNKSGGQSKGFFNLNSTMKSMKRFTKKSTKPIRNFFKS